MKAVLLSVQPKYVEKICSKIKTIEVRKNRPKIDTPFKCYIYCTKTDKKGQPLLVDCGGRMGFGDWRNAFNCDGEGKVDFYIAEGKVIGDFTCDFIVNGKESAQDWVYITENSGLSGSEIYKYCGEDKYGETNYCYGWHISNLKIYDKPRELSEFYPIKPKKIEDWTDKDDCAHCKYHKWVGSMQEYVEKGKPMREKCTLGKPEPICEYTPPITRPPQSWCYVEQS